MSIRVILVPLFGDTADQEALGTGFDLARRFDAHAASLFVRVDPLDTVPVVGEGISPAIIEQLTQAAATEIARRRTAARAACEAACTAAGLPLLEASPGAGTASAAWLEVTGRRDEVVPAHARVSDLVVMARGDGDAASERRPIVEATLLGSGRPLVLLPPGQGGAVGRRIAIAWNGRAEAARAVASALPLIDRAEAVHVLVAATWRTASDVGTALIEYLKWRGITAAPVEVEVGAEPVAAALLTAAATTGADLVVMGGYGRTRLSELVLGGVTRHALGNAELPILLAH